MEGIDTSKFTCVYEKGINKGGLYNLRLRGKFSLRQNWKIIVALIIGIGLSIVGTQQYKTYINEHREVISVIVVNKNIPPYSKIREEDLGMRDVVKGTESNDRCVNPEDAIGKVTTIEIKRGEQITKSKLIDAKLVEDREILAVNVSPSRLAGGWAQPGDLVDIWWIIDNEGMQGAPGTGWIKVGENARVVDIRDSNGRRVIDIGKEADQGTGSIAVLAVRRQDVPMIVGGAIEGSNNTVLVVKYSESISTPVIESGGTEGIVGTIQGALNEAKNQSQIVR